MSRTFQYPQNPFKCLRTTETTEILDFQITIANVQLMKCNETTEVPLIEHI